jgi:hypothetical protein
VIEFGEYYYWGEPRHVVKALHPLPEEYITNSGPCWLILMFVDNASVDGLSRGLQYRANQRTLVPISDIELLKLRLTGQLNL